MAKIRGGRQTTQHKQNKNMTGNIAIAGAALGATVALGLIGLKACEAVGRNPGASGKVLVQSLLISALAEGALIITILLGSK
jgi:F-type H+-transporting ATPase subunit c